MTDEVDLYTEPTADVPTRSPTSARCALMAGVCEGSHGSDDVHPGATGDGVGSVYVERNELQPIDPQTNGPQLFYGLRYHQHILKPGEVETFHDQVGYWLWEPATETVSLSLAIPRAQVVLASGHAAPGRDRVHAGGDARLDDLRDLLGPVPRRQLPHRRLRRDGSHPRPRRLAVRAARPPDDPWTKRPGAPLRRGDAAARRTTDAEPAGAGVAAARAARGDVGPWGGAMRASVPRVTAGRWDRSGVCLHCQPVIGARADGRTSPKGGAEMAKVCACSTTTRSTATRRPTRATTSRSIERYPDGQTTPTPQRHRLHARAAARQRVGRARPARLPRGAGHTLGRDVGQGRAGLRVRARAARRRRRDLPAVLARLPHRGADRDRAEPQARDHRGHRVGPRGPAGGDRPGHDGRGGDLLEQHQRLGARGHDDPVAGAQLHPVLRVGGPRRVEHRRLRRSAPTTSRA